MYIDLNKGKEVKMGTSLKESLRINKGIKQELIRQLGISNLLFLESKTLGELVEWLANENYINTVKYNLKEVYDYLGWIGYRVDINLIKTEGFSKEIHTEEDYVLELIHSLPKVKVYRVQFKYNKLLEQERQKKRGEVKEKSKYKIVNLMRERNDTKTLENLDRYSNIVEWYLIELIEDLEVKEVTKEDTKEEIESLLD